MSILNREEFLNQIKAHLGDDTSDESIQFLENATDTFDDLEKRANGDGVDWKAKAEQIDADWRKKYRERFFNPNSKDDEDDRQNDNDKPKKLTFENLFKEG